LNSSIALRSGQSGVHALAFTILTARHLPDALSWHSYTVESLPKPSLCATRNRPPKTSPRATGW
jgi:hypothetical protein